MEREMLAYFDNILEGLLQEVIPATRSLYSSLEENANHHGPMDEVDLTTFRNEQQLIIQTQQRKREHARNIVNALKRIEENKFGICEGCGWNIGLNRLKVQPTATLCIACMKELERPEANSRYIERAMPL